MCVYIQSCLAVAAVSFIYSICLCLSVIAALTGKKANTFDYGNFCIDFIISLSYNSVSVIFSLTSNNIYNIFQGVLGF